MKELKNDSSQVQLALVHHANQYVITNGYADRQGMNDILGLSNPIWGPSVHRTGFLPLLQMHLDYNVPLNLHLSGTLMETLVWHYPESFSLIKRLIRERLLEIVGSTFSQNVMPFFSEDYNLRQINEELWMYREHLGIEPHKIKVFWVPERVWNTEKLAKILTNSELLNGGYKTVLLDDRLAYAGGTHYPASDRERFDHERRFEREAFYSWEIENGCGLRMLPISRELRYSIPPSNHESWQRLQELVGWLAYENDKNMIAVYADDLERAAGVGGWDMAHSERYEQLLKWVSENPSIKTILLKDWIGDHEPVAKRNIEQGTFYELAQQWNAGENYRGWYEDPNCQEHRNYLVKAEQALLEAEQVGADKGLIALGWKHLLHCSYETAWHNRADESPHYHQLASADRPMWLAPWAAALTSHARACLVIAQAARWFVDRDGIAHAQLIDIDDDGEQELVIKNDKLFAVFTPCSGGRLIYLFDLTGVVGRLLIGNVSDDWNLQEELNRYMDCPRNHPGALADVGYEHNRYEAAISVAHGDPVSVRLSNVELGSPLFNLEKQIRLARDDGYISITYTTPENLRRISTEICLSPDYQNLLSYGRRDLTVFNGPSWKGWSNGSTRTWVRIDPKESTMWDRPYQAECGHGLNLRVTSFSREFHLELGLNHPPRQLTRQGLREQRTTLRVSPAVFKLPPKPLRASARAGSDKAGGGTNAAESVVKPADEVRSQEHTDQILQVTNPHFMRRFLNNNLPAMQHQAFEIAACRVRVLKPHHDKLTIEYNLQCHNGKKSDTFVYDLVGTWRQDTRNHDMDGLYRRLWLSGFSRTHSLSIPKPSGYWTRLHLRLREKASGKLLRDWINYPDTDWSVPLRRVGAWLAKLHSCGVDVQRRFSIENECLVLEGWRADLMNSNAPWLAHEVNRVDELIGEMIHRTRNLKLDRPCITHGDFHPENIFVRGQSVTVIDFEQSAMADPSSDLGYLLGELDVQSDRYWHKRGRFSPLDIERASEPIIAEYSSQCEAQNLERIPFYCARTYLKHLIHTVRMR
ncbi:MAG TPA: phosphotransferase, partial [Pyrinomonadaceae bacterium]|nr:phosphotransferase [Pyrinomonadaceae bacterium]